MGFYDLSEDERAALTNSAIGDGRTVMERWGDLQPKEFAVWDARGPVIARMLAGCRSVADIGCGFMDLKKHLDPDVRYVPVDVADRGEGTIVLDLNTEPMPALAVEGWALAGLLEYLHDVPRLFASLNGVVAVSYNVLEFSTINRRAHAWVNDYTTEEMEGIFAAAGFAVEARERLHQQWIWRLRQG